MRKRLLLAMFVAVLSILALPNAASAADVFHFRGLSAFASFTMTDPSGCVRTDVFIVASETQTQSPPGRPDRSGIFALSEEFFLLCDGGASRFSGSASLAKGDFQVRRNLDVATLEATISFCVNLDCNPIFVDVTWNGIGDLRREHSSFHLNTPDLKVHSRSILRNRSAVASGTVRLCDSCGNEIPNPTDSAEIMWAQSGQVVIE
jgi:hypothetical protein